MSRVPRDRAADRAALHAAIERLLAGTPLRSTGAKLTSSELIIESGLRRDVVYGHHKDLVELFRARAKAQNDQPTAVQEADVENQRLRTRIAALTEELAAERCRATSLAKLVAELSLELEQAKHELAHAASITRLPPSTDRRRSEGDHDR